MSGPREFVPYRFPLMVLLQDGCELHEALVLGVARFESRADLVDVVWQPGRGVVPLTEVHDGQRVLGAAVRWGEDVPHGWSWMWDKARRDHEAECEACRPPPAPKKRAPPPRRPWWARLFGWMR